jgi:hypothetical protein
MELKSFTDHSKSNQNLPRHEQVHYEQEERGNDYYHNYPQQAYPSPPYQSQPIQNYSFGPRSPPQFMQAPAAAHYVQQQVYPAQPQPYYHPPPHQAAPVYYIPHYARIEYPARSFNPNGPNQAYTVQPTGVALPFQPQSHPEDDHLEAIPLQSRKSNTSGLRNGEDSHDEIKKTVVSKVNIQVTAHEEEKNGSDEYQHLEDEHTEEAHFIEPVTTTQRNNAFSETDDLVARSLPIKAGYPSQATQQLSTMGQSERAIYSHINLKDQKLGNTDGFGLTKNSQLKLKDSAMSSQKAVLTASKPKVKLNPIKYFYSLDEELEIDPDIAADMAKYLS